MNDRHGAHASTAQCIDWLFQRLPTDAMAPLSATTGSAGVAAAGPHRRAPEPPPVLETTEDFDAARKWLQAERARMDEYTRHQFDLIRQQHQALVNKHLRSEEALAMRAQELNREMHFLGGQTESLQKRARQLTEREQALARQVERFLKIQEECLASRPAGEPTEPSALTQRESLVSLRSETAQFQELDKAAQQQFDAFEDMIKDRQRAWERKQDEITARQAEMERRYRALEQAEASAQRRLAELDEMEDRLRAEFVEG